MQRVTLSLLDSNEEDIELFHKDNNILKVNSNVHEEI